MLGNSGNALALSTIAAAFLGCHPAQAASFDCRAATTAVEHMVCANTRLSEQDEHIAQAYRSVLQSAKQPDVVRADQRQWLRRMAQCANVACVDASQQMRLSQLQSQLSSRMNHLTQVGDQIEGGARNTVTVTAVRHLGSRNAAIDVQLTQKDAIDFCQGYVGERVATRGCINEWMTEFGTEMKELRANCQTGVFSIYGQPFMFHGRNRMWKPDLPDSIEHPEYLIKDLVSGDILPDTGASDYGLDLGLFERLCPEVVEHAPQVSP